MSASKEAAAAEALGGVLETSIGESGSLTGASALLDSHIIAIRLAPDEDALGHAIDVAASIAVVTDLRLVVSASAVKLEDRKVILATASVTSTLSTRAFEVARAVISLAAAGLQAEAAVALGAVLDTGKGEAFALAVDHAAALGHASLVDILIADQDTVRDGIGVASIVGPTAWKDSARAKVWARVRSGGELGCSSQQQSSERVMHLARLKEKW